ncbi:MAG: FtsX-like permease family protein, partial [Cellulosilyticaceae bacterium]
MYIKLALRNARRSIKEYAIYIVTLTLCVALFYAFLAVTSDYYHPEFGALYGNLEMIGEGLPFAIVGVSSLLLFLVYFVNKHIMLQKQKEFGLEILLGMSQQTVAWIFFCETFIMGIFSLVLGIGLGVMCSQFTNALLLTTFDQPFVFVLALFPDTTIQTIALFIGVFILIGLSNGYTLSKRKVVEMLGANQEHEAGLSESRFVPICTVCFVVLMCYMTRHGYLKAQMHFKFDNRHPLLVQMMFYGNIFLPLSGVLISGWYLLKKWRGQLVFVNYLKRLMVIIVLMSVCYLSVPIMRTVYSITFDSSEVLTYMQFLVISMIYLIIAFYYLCGSLFAQRKENSLAYRYHEENLFFCGQIMSRLQTSSKTMSV